MTTHEHDHQHDHEIDADKAGHSHAHGHSHGHSHAHGHTHVPTGSKAFAVGIGLNAAFVIAEVIYGLASNSISLIADAAHNTGDVLGLCLAWIATILAKRAPTGRRTYGMRRSTILASLANAVLLLVAIGGVVWEAIQRIQSPDIVNGSMVIIVAAIGVAINGLSALFFFRGKDSDTNIRAAFLHLAADAAVSLAVVIGGLIILRTGWQVVDPILSIIVSLVILWSTWSLFKDALNLSLDAVPNHIDLQEVQNLLTSLPGVTAVHDLHVWAMSTTEVALTAHLEIPWAATPPEFLHQLTKDLEQKFGIMHCTIQFEPQELARKCAQAIENSL